MQSVFNLTTGSGTSLGNDRVNGRPSLHVKGHVQGSKTPMYDKLYLTAGSATLCAA